MKSVAGPDIKEKDKRRCFQLCLLIEQRNCNCVHKLSALKNRLASMPNVLLHSSVDCLRLKYNGLKNSA